MDNILRILRILVSATVLMCLPACRPAELKDTNVVELALPTDSTFSVKNDTIAKA